MDTSGPHAHTEPASGSGQAPSKEGGCRRALLICLAFFLVLVAVGAFSLLDRLRHLGDCWAQTAAASVNGNQSGPVAVLHVTFHTTQAVADSTDPWPPTATANVKLAEPGAPDGAMLDARVFPDGKDVPVIDARYPLFRASQWTGFSFSPLADCPKAECSAGFTIVVQTESVSSIEWSIDAQTYYGCGGTYLRPDPHLFTAAVDSSRTIETMPAREVTLAQTEAAIDMRNDHGSVALNLALDRGTAAWDPKLSPVVVVAVSSRLVPGHPWLPAVVEFTSNGKVQIGGYFASADGSATGAFHPFDACPPSGACSGTILVEVSRDTGLYDPPTPTAPTDASATVTVAASVLYLPVGASVVAQPDAAVEPGSAVLVIVAALVIGSLAALAAAYVQQRRDRRSA